jgi:2-isopropylmalate synthase
MTSIEIYDTTLRDGAQGEGVAFSLEDKLKVVTRLVELGFPFIEGGWPGSNAKDAEFFRRVRALPLRQTRIAAFGATRRAGVSCEADPQIGLLLEAETPVVTLVGKTWDLHVHRVLETTLDENRAMIADSVRHITGRERQVFYDAEHFFDGYKANPDYALATIRAAYEAGATRVVLCDTNGGSLPWEVGEIVGAAQSYPRTGNCACRSGSVFTPTTTAEWRWPTPWPPCVGCVQCKDHQRLRGACGKLQPVYADPRPAAQDGNRLFG